MLPYHRGQVYPEREFRVLRGVVPTKIERYGGSEWRTYRIARKFDALVVDFLREGKAARLDMRVTCASNFGKELGLDSDTSDWAALTIEFKDAGRKNLTAEVTIARILGGDPSLTVVTVSQYAPVQSP
jgi:hypothetical protein